MALLTPVLGLIGMDRLQCEAHTRKEMQALEALGQES